MCENVHRVKGKPGMDDEMASIHKVEVNTEIVTQKKRLDSTSSCICTHCEI